jgi:hypothetical protein
MQKTIDDFKKGGYDQLEFNSEGLASVQYLGQEIVTTQWGDRVKLAVFDLVNLNETAIYTTSAKLLRLLFDELKIEINDKITIKRNGTGYATKYQAKIISKGEGQPAQPTTNNENATQQTQQTQTVINDPF